MIHRKIKDWVIPPQSNAAFVANMEQVLDTYQKPYDPACPVLCMDEQPVRLIKETRPPIEATAAPPKHGSWLNIAENELRSLTRQCLAGRRIGDLKTLQEETRAWSTDVNHTQRGVDWQIKIDDARCKLKSVYPTIKV